MSAESEAIFHEALHGYPDTHGADALRAAAVGHLGASRRLAQLISLYADAVANGTPEEAQALADELAPVRAAARVADGGLPRTTGG